jgi:hypothetical protein
MEGQAVPIVPPSAGATRSVRGLLRMEALIPVMIAAVSLIGAAVTWQASDTSARAGGLDAQALRETVELQQIHSRIEAVVAHDRRIFGEYQEHILAWRDIARRAAEATSTEAARELRFEAHGRLAMARALRPLFRVQIPGFGDKDGLVEYDADAAVTILRTGDDRLEELDPEATLELARETHERAIALVAVVIMLVGALFLLTVAELGRGRLRVSFGALGIITAIAASGAFIVVELGVR